MPAFTFADAPPLVVDHYHPSPATIVLVAHGDVDASNACDLVTAVRHALESCDGLVLDLTAVGFFGAQGLRALDIISECSTPRVVLVPSPAVSRLLQLCATAPPMRLAEDVDAAVTMVQAGLRSLRLLI